MHHRSLPSESCGIAWRGTHKLIRVLQPNGITNNQYCLGFCDLLFDLENDPLETNDLLAAPLSAAQQAAYDALVVRLELIMSS